MAKRITIDPITRIEGHLRIDVEVDNNTVSNAWASCTMWRGIEKILRGRDPRDAWLFTQRFCGVCTTVHAMASVRAVEDALKLEVPLNAQYIRNLILIAHALHDHIVHFYQLSALDWVDILQIPKADPDRTAKLAESLSPWTRNSRNEFKAAQDKVNAVASSGQLGIFMNGYWGHPAMRLSPDVNLLAFAHYVQALEYQRKALQVVGILGSKTPHIQNLTVGGVANAIDLDSPSALGMDRLEQIRVLLDEVVQFIHQVYFVDVCAVAAMYADWFKIGSGVRNYLAVPDLPLDSRGSAYDLPGGYIMNGNIAGVHSFQTASDKEFRESVSEDVTHAYYRDGKSLHPWVGETEPAFTGWDSEQKYSWVKAPRFKGEPMQVGPLAQVLVGYAQGHPLTRKYADLALSKVSAIAGVRATPEMLHSTLGRHAARAIRAAMLAELAQKHWQLLVDNIAKGDFTVHNPPEFPWHEVEGVGTHEAPRGTLSHWVVINDEKIKNYQAVVPSTWNASPRDRAGAHGPYEAALLRTPLARPEEPLEVLRTVHSFDPCMACACHAFDPAGRRIAKVKVL
ncbi:MAG TPA: nickel-dependent hydrogenase large subunit [Terriglobales bacterium]|nr:nickel-dependent hydrogenase large subunit [Terriglobales bacterium]